MHTVKTNGQKSTAPPVHMSKCHWASSAILYFKSIRCYFAFVGNSLFWHLSKYLYLYPPLSELVHGSWKLGSLSLSHPPAPGPPSGMGWPPCWGVSAGSRLPCYSGATASPFPPPSLIQAGGCPTGRRGWGACLPLGIPELVLGRGCKPLAWESAALWGFPLMFVENEVQEMQWSCLCSWRVSLSPCLSSHHPWSRDLTRFLPLLLRHTPLNHWHPPIHLHHPLHVRYSHLPEKRRGGREIIKNTIKSWKYITCNNWSFYPLGGSETSGW